MKSITALSIHDRPREKMYRKGAAALSDIELLAVILGRGCVGCDVLSLSRQVQKLMNEPGGLSLQKLQSIKGLGRAKALQILACDALIQRRAKPTGQLIQGPKDILPLVGHLAHKKQEHFLSFTLDGAGQLIKQRTLMVGLLNRIEIHPREVFADAIRDRAAAIILAHNHPSQNLEPSKADRETTNQLFAAAKLLGIELLDHLIFHGTCYFSFREEGLLEGG